MARYVVRILDMMQMVGVESTNQVRGPWTMVVLMIVPMIVVGVGSTHQPRQAARVHEQGHGATTVAMN